MKLEIEVDVGDRKKANAVAVALAADSKPKRGTIDFSSKQNNIIIEINSDDNVAMRAAVNSTLRVMDACLSVIGE